MSETKTLTVYRGDYGYNLSWTLKNADGTAFTLTGYTVKFKVWPLGKPSQLLVNGTCDPVNENAGTLTYTVAQNDFLETGQFLAEFEATKTGYIESFNSFTLIVKESP